MPLNNNANIKAIITAEDRASATIANFGQKTSRAGMLIKRGLLATSAAAVAFGISSVKSFSESENAVAQLNAVLKSTKGVAGVTSKAAQDLSASLQMVTKYSDEEILSAENLLLTFTKIGKDIFPKTTEIVLDMSTALGQDLKASAIQVGKALQDPILGVTALRRVGVNFSSAQREVIKKLVETGQSAKAQAMILKELQVEFGGSARAAGDTLSGKLKILGNRFDEVKEKVGGFIANGLIKLTNVFFGTQKQTDVTAQKMRDLQVAQDIAKGATQRLKDAQNNYNAAVKRYGPNSAQAKKAHELLTKAELDHKLATNAVKNAQNQLNKSEYNYRMNTPKMLNAIQQRINKFGLLVDYVGSGIRSVKQLDQAIKAVGKGGPSLNVNKAIKSGGLSQNAAGTDYWRGGSTWVGEKGPEIVNLPRGSQIIPNDRSMRMGGNSTNIVVNIGIYAGSEVEKRKVAKAILDAYKDLAASKNMTASQLLS